MLVPTPDPPQRGSINLAHNQPSLTFGLSAMPTFDPSILNALRTEQEVRIRTSAQPDRGVTIWIVVVNDTPFARSYRGPKSKWYVAALADRRATLEAGAHSAAVQIAPAADAATIAAVSQAFLTKYTSSPYANAMVAPETLDTTLRLDPA